MPDGDIGRAIANKYITSEKWEEAYVSCTSEIRRISIYTGMNFNDVLNLPYSLYLLYRKESWVDSWNRTEEGREFLKTLWRLNQTKADLKAIREHQNKGVK
ncbi:hypothetical protein H7E67_02195 [Clostridium gasigenes]|nr:hypothetical protein [Clostridium gasigenes]